MWNEEEQDLVLTEPLTLTNPEEEPNEENDN